MIAHRYMLEGKPRACCACCGASLTQVGSVRVVYAARGVESEVLSRLDKEGFLLDGQDYLADAEAIVEGGHHKQTMCAGCGTALVEFDIWTDEQGGTLAAFARGASSGGLNGMLVSNAFWPSCSNCLHYDECAVSPKHEAYPHNWHWGNESVTFPEGRLVLVSWVGTLEIGAPHTGCTSYEVAASELVAQSGKHLTYMRLERERRQLEALLSGAEARSDESPYAESPCGEATDSDPHGAEYERLEQIGREQQGLLAA